MLRDELLEEEYYSRYYGYHGDFCNEEIDDYDDPNEFIPRIKGTELEMGIAFLWFNYFPIITSRVNDGIRKCYLFDFIKIWQTIE